MYMPNCNLIEYPNIQVDIHISAQNQWLPMYWQFATETKNVDCPITSVWTEENMKEIQTINMYTETIFKKIQIDISLK